MLAQHLGQVAHLSVPLFDVREAELVAYPHVVQLFDNCVVKGEVKVAFGRCNRECRRQHDHDWVLHAD